MLLQSSLVLESAHPHLKIGKSLLAGASLVLAGARSMLTGAFPVLFSAEIG